METWGYCVYCSTAHIRDECHVVYRVPIQSLNTLFNEWRTGLRPVSCTRFVDESGFFALAALSSALSDFIEED